ncbi:MAG: P-II family nitrogen regulator [Chlorobi bacterium]|nr:P-II family nitrogen regulator [Chlorobiota bacterium]
MKEIKAFIRPEKVNNIIEQLKAEGYENITISEAEGTGKFQSENAFVSQKFSITDSKIAKLELVAKDKNVDKIIEIISKYGKTINPGDGLIYVACVDKAYRVKTGEENGYK